MPRTFEDKIKTLGELETLCRALRAEGKRIGTRAFACFLRPVGDGGGDCDGGAAE